jgi:P22 coat protein - gene protein 5
MAGEFTSQNAALAIPKLVASYALPALFANLVMGAIVNRNYDGTLANAGDTVNVPIAPNLVSNNIAEAGAVQNQNPSLGNAQIVLNTHQEATFQIINVAQVLAAPDLLQTLLQPAVVAIAEKIESDLLNLYPLLTFNASVGTANTPITENTVDLAETALFSAKMPDSIPKFSVVSGSTYSNLRQIGRFSEERIAPGLGGTMYTGQVGKLKNVTFFRSQKVITSGSTTNNIVFGSDALCLVSRQLPQVTPGTGAMSYNMNFGGFNLRVVLSFNPNTLGQQITVDVLYGVGVLRNQFGVLLLT